MIEGIKMLIGAYVVASYVLTIPCLTPNQLEQLIKIFTTNHN